MMLKCPLYKRTLVLSMFDCEMLFQVRYDDSVMDYFDSLLFGQLVDATFLALNE